jgi:hypothetical protein
MAKFVMMMFEFSAKSKDRSSLFVEMVSSASKN